MLDGVLDILQGLAFAQLLLSLLLLFSHAVQDKLADLVLHVMDIGKLLDWQELLLELAKLFNLNVEVGDLQVAEL